MKNMTMINDHELIYMVRQQDDKAFELIRRKYELMIYRIAHDLIKKYPYVYSVQDDLIQEGLIALNNAAIAYREDNHAKFMTFAYIVIQRQMKNYLRTSVKTYTNEYAYEDLSVQERGGAYGLNDYSENPSTIFFNNYESEQLRKAYKAMNQKDKIILKYKLQGRSYVEIAELCQLTRKQVDNRLQKIKQYLVDYLN